MFNFANQYLALFVMMEYRIVHNGNPATTIYLCIGNHNKDINEIVNALGRNDFHLVALMSNDWNGDYSPWAAPPVFGKEGFAGNGRETLRWLMEECVPNVEKDARPDNRIIAGYSLAGLFALWAAMETKMFSGVVSCSGSLWFPSWIDYLESKRLPHATNVYLSLGDKEEKTHNAVMASVGNNTRKTLEILKSQCNATLEWNAGGHFNEPISRLAKGIVKQYHQR